AAVSEVRIGPVRAAYRCRSPRGYNHGATGPAPRVFAVLTQRLDLKLLFPIVVVCLILVGVSLAGSLYLSHLHVNVSEDLAENVRRTETAGLLEATVQQMIDQLTRPRPGSDEQLAQLDNTAEDQLHQAEALANYDPEKDFVRRIADGLDEYRKDKAQ